MSTSHLTHSTARGDPAPFVFRQETGMQRGGEHTERKGRKEMGYFACVSVYVRVRMWAFKDNLTKAAWEEHKNPVTFMNRKKRKCQDLYAE